MADTFTKEKRSWIMSQVKSSHNLSTELKLIHFFQENKIKGWRRNFKLFGKPDFVFPTLKLTVFVDGCFWHGHDCRNVSPKNNKIYWKGKIIKNKQRDKIVNSKLKSANWKIIRIWECELRKNKILNRKFNIILT
ncbi:MAG: very short patch repair endonuclease [Chlorobi bacterium]|nr:very short patch repair endonuclease [Chlorobiota bacterium]MCI0715358.1 very short patch repair endonuclease [Chlorobiota bacterium]